MPANRTLSELTVELVEMLGSPDGHARSGLAVPVLSAWIARGVYDDLLPGLGDGMCAGFGVGRGERDTDSVFRRSYSALMLAAILRRDNEARLVHPDKVLRWGDRLLWWFLGEQDLRGHVEGSGWAYAVGHGADTLAALGVSRHIDAGGLTVLLEALADRLLAPTPYTLVDGEDDRLAYATMAVLRRNLLGLDALTPWLRRIGAAARAQDTTPLEPRAANSRAFLRALHLQVLLGATARPGSDQGHGQSAGEPARRVELLDALGGVLRLGHTLLPGPLDSPGGQSTPPAD